MLDDALTEPAEGVVLAVVVAPRAGKTGLDRIEPGALRVRVAAPPVDGAANTALISFLAGILDRPRTSLRLLSGATGRRKRILLTGLTRAEATARLRPLLPTP
jgi:uncharacterized protein (TIGR00251 family)